MDSTVKRKPMTLAELLPELGGILSIEARQTLTANKLPRPKIAATRTTEKVLKPLTIAEMRAGLQALRVQSPRRYTEGTASNKKKWNSSVKVDKKTVNLTANGQLKNNSVRKVLNFQPPKPKPPKMSMMSLSRPTMNTEIPKFPKPELKAKKSLHIQDRTNVRISGVYQIPETPVYKPPKSRMTIANKENVASQPLNKKVAVTPKPALLKRVITRNILDTPMSYASSCDESFLQKEKEIESTENKNNASEDKSLEKISDISPPVSTPFKQYRNVTEFFNNSSAMENSNIYNDNTIMCFDASSSKENSKREESVIVSLCDMLNKAAVSNAHKQSTALDDLLEVEKQTEHNIKMIETGIQTLENIKASHIKSLEYVKKLIKEKRENNPRNSESDKDKTVIENTKETYDGNTSLNQTQVAMNPGSVIKKSPAYKIPKKNTCLRKKVFHKSMPNVSSITPEKDMGDKAFNIYMKMKEHMQFLSTPSVKQRTEIPDTPAITSHNLQKQLDKLYTQS